MTPADGSVPWAIWFLGEIAFKWVPGAAISIVETNVSGIPGAPTPPSALMNPVTAPQVVQYLQLASAPGAYENLFNIWSTFVAFSLLMTLGLAALVIYCTVRMFQVRQMDTRRFAALQQTVAAHDVPKTNLRWNRISEEANSESERAWRLAILEADIMLNELLDTLGYRGETIADKLRAADRAEFRTLDLAWEAHRFRNQIAHQGEAVLVSARDVHRIISNYERVFREFKFID